MNKLAYGAGNMDWNLLLSESYKVSANLETLPSDVICTCGEGRTLLYDPNNRQYLPEGGCDQSGICACISIEKHKARTSTRHFLRAERNRKAKEKNTGPLDRFFVVEP